MKHFKLLLTAICLLCCVSINAQTVQIDGLYYYLYNGVARLTYQEREYDDGDYYYTNTQYQSTTTVPSTVTYGGTKYTVTTIDEGAVENTSSTLKILKLPSTITTIDEGAFHGANNLILYIEATTPPTIRNNDDDWSYESTLNGLSKVYVPAANASAYKSAAGWSTIASNIIAYDPNATYVSTITLDKTSAELSPGKTLQLSATVSPSNATNSGVTWTTSYSTVATVSSTGLVTAKAAGTATITATAADGGGAKATCTIKVVNYVTGITLATTSGSAGIISQESASSISYNMYTGGYVNLTATVTPTTASNKKVTWTSSNTSKATITKTDETNGTCQIYNNGSTSNYGSATITATAADGSGITAQCVINIYKPESSDASLNYSSLTLNKGASSTLTYSFSSSDNIYIRSEKWTSSDESVATVDSNGKVTAVGSGNATITCVVDGYYKHTLTCSVTVPNPVTSIALNKTATTIWDGATETLSVTYTPTDADSRSVTWSSSNTSVATVSTAGVVTGKGKGTATITATSANGKTATCSVTVKQPVTAISLSATNATLWVGKTQTLTATATPTTANSTAVTWSSSNTSVATVSSSGVITAVAKGTATITCTASDGYGTKATCSVTVKQPVTSISLSATSATLWVGKTQTLTATATPTTANSTAVTWSSSNTSVATVSSSGVITAVAKGTATITCTASDGYGTKATCSVTVKQQVTGITLSGTTLALTKGGTSTLTATVTPTTANNTGVTWSSSNTAVATVTSAGVVTAVKTGTATITCTASDGQGANATCAVTVTTPVSGITISKSATTITIGGTETLTASTNSDADNTGITWSSSDENIATVSSAGVITAKVVGKATITATSSADATKTATCTVTTSNICVDGIYYVVTDATNKTAAVTYATTDYNSYSGDVVIPSTVTISGTQYSVTEIGQDAFTNSSNLNNLTIASSITVLRRDALKNTSLTSIELPEGVQTLERGALYNNTSLKSLTLPTTLKTVGQDAFLSCTALEALYIKNLEKWLSVSFYDYKATPLYSAKTKNAYLNGSLITDLTIPNTISKVPYCAFYNWTCLKKVTISEGVTSLGSSAFSECLNIETLVLPSTLSSIGGYSFCDLQNLKSAYLLATTAPSVASNGLLNIPTTAKVHVYTNALADYQANTTWNVYDLTDDFDNPSAGSLSTIVGTNPTSLKVSGDLNGTDIKYIRSLINDYSLTSLDMSGANIVAGGDAYYGTNVTTANTIGTNMFNGCAKMKSIILPKTITKIDGFAFRSCSGLTTLTIPASVTNLAYGIFEDSHNIASIAVDDGNTVYASVDGDVYSNDMNTLYTVATAKMGKYTVKDGVTYIDRKAFISCTAITDVEIPATVAGIGYYAFYGDTQIKSITCRATTPPTTENSTTTSSNSLYSLDKTNCIVKVPYTSLASYRTTDYWKDFTNITSIEGYAESVSLDKTEASILPYLTVTLTATTTGATPGVTWTTSDASVATVADGVVTGVKAGTVTITATANDGGKQSATCTVTIGTPAAPEGVELVDLGLPSGTLWATMNVGATTPEGIGENYAWGEVQPKDNYTWATYKWANGTNTTLTKYCTDSSYGTVDNKTQLDVEDDAAYVNWGSDWRMATGDQLKELYSNCTFTASTYNDISVYVVTGVNGNSIIIPKNGYMSGTQHNGACDYWGSTTNKFAKNNDGADAYMIWSDAAHCGNASRYFGFAVRPVSATQKAIRVTSVTINETTEKIVIGNTTKLTATIAPTTAWDKTYVWSSSDETVATVDASGNITTVGAGTATITASAKDGSGVTGTCALTVIARGDVTGDGTIDNSDITGCVKFAMGDTDTDALYADAADYNKNGKVNTTDAIAIVRLALNGTTTYSAASKGMRAESSTSNLLALDNIEMESGTTKDVAIRLTDHMDKFTNLMFDVTLPEGVTIDNVTVGSRAASHSSVYSQHEDGTVRVICYSLTNDEFTQTDGDIVKLTLKADKDVFDGAYDVNFRNIKLVRKDVTSLISESENATLNIGGTTGLRSYNIGDGDMSATYHGGYLTIQATKDGLATVYASSGALIYKNNLHAGEKVTVAVPRGVYIINGTKTAVK